MANYYSDHPEIGFYLNHPLMARIVELKEKGFADAKEYDYAPVDLGDAIEKYTANAPKGEFVLVVDGAAPVEKEVPTAEDAGEMVKRLMSEGLSRKDAIKQTAKALDLPKNVVYDAALNNNE
mgnify:CR=1 FL=1